MKFSNFLIIITLLSSQMGLFFSNQILKLKYPAGINKKETIDNKVILERFNFFLFFYNELNQIQDDNLNNQVNNSTEHDDNKNNEESHVKESYTRSSLNHIKKVERSPVTEIKRTFYISFIDNRYSQAAN